MEAAKMLQFSCFLDCWLICCYEEWIAGRVEDVKLVY